MSMRTLCASLVLLALGCDVPDKSSSSEPETSGGESSGGESSGETGPIPPDQVMCAADRLVFPVYVKQCATVDDCAMVIHQTDCCGNMAALGIDKDEVPAFDAAEALCQSQYPECACPTMGFVAEDGAVVQTVEAIDLVCVEGACKTVVEDPCAGVDLPACPPECGEMEYPELCGLPCDTEGQTCGNNIGDGMTCSGGQWLCTVHPPLGPGCNLVCK